MTILVFSYTDFRWTNNDVAHWLFQPHLLGQLRYVHCELFKSATAWLICSSSKDLVLGPLVFIWCITNLITLTRRHLVFSLEFYDSCQPVCVNMFWYVPIDAIEWWMESNRLQFNFCGSNVVCMKSGHLCRRRSGDKDTCAMIGIATFCCISVSYGKFAIMSRRPPWFSWTESMLVGLPVYMVCQFANSWFQLLQHSWSVFCPAPSA